MEMTLRHTSLAPVSKNRPSTSLSNLIVFAFVVSLPFEDSHLQDTPLGYAGASFALIPAGILFILKLLSRKINIFFLAYLLYAIALSTIYLYITTYDPYFMLNRGLRLFFLYSIYFFTFSYFITAQFNFSSFVKTVFISALLSLALTIGPADLISNNSLLHFTENQNQRPRGLSIENSMFGFYVACSLLLTGIYYKIPTTSLAIALIITSFLIQSKGALSAAILTALTYFLVFSSSTLLKKLSAFALLAPAACILVILTLLPSLIADIANYTSVATRATLGILSITALLTDPLGVGFTGYMQHFYDHGPAAMSFLDSISPHPLNFQEVEGYFHEGAYKNVGAKSLFFDMVILFGWPFVILAAVFFVKVIKISRTTNQPQRLLLLLFTFFALFSYVTPTGTYASAAFLGLLLNRNFKKS